jgi:hypothetical protein
VTEAWPRGWGVDRAGCAEERALAVVFHAAATATSSLCTPSVTPVPCLVLLRKVCYGTTSSGGGLFLQGGAVTLDRVAVTGNGATLHGGGVAVQGASVALDACTVGGKKREKKKKKRRRTSRIHARCPCLCVAR